jgi:hypothetical protein
MIVHKTLSSLRGVAMSLIGTALLNSLRSVERTGDFCVDGIREIFMPTIDVDGVGRIAFPLLSDQVERLVARVHFAQPSMLHTSNSGH